MDAAAHLTEAERLALVIHNQVGNQPMSAEATIALGQLHATIAIAKQVEDAGR